ncbi:hypothetical protein D3C73_764220 [compost metagenome]
MQPHMLFNRSCHFRVKRVQYLCPPVNNCHFKATFPQILRHLQSDKTRSNHRGMLRMLIISKSLDFVCVRDISQCEQVIGTGDPRNLRYNGLCSGRKNHNIIRNLLDLSCGYTPGHDKFACAVNGCSLRQRPYINIKPLTYPLRRLKKQFLPGINRAANVIRQAAIGKRDMLTALQQDNFILLI